MRRWRFLAGGLVACLLLAGVVSGFAATSPDGLAHAAREGCTIGPDGEVVAGTCPAQAEREHDLAGGPFAGYGIRGLAGDRLGTGLAGVFGVLLTGGLCWLLLRRRAPAGPTARARE